MYRKQRLTRARYGRVVSNKLNERTASQLCNARPILKWTLA